jgi:hypothetical protein
MKKILRLTESELVRLVKKVIKEQQKDYSFLDTHYADKYKKDGYIEVKQMQLPAGTYLRGGSGNAVVLFDSNKKNTGYILLMKRGIRGPYNGKPMELDGDTWYPDTPDTPEEDGGLYKILFNKKVVGQIPPFI